MSDPFVTGQMTPGYAPGRALRIPDPDEGQPLTDDMRAAIDAGHVAQVVVFCDGCGVEHRADYTGADKHTRFAAARQHLADNERWDTSGTLDLCPACKAVPA
ncbi:hypothetical protein [Catenuloplanes japonicus]|uniref:hypothetical protein n=1 Tax=Catenuloplanes japonicus TaxID=33876 RepID=UPI000524AF1F|nr:hypothetical protein [Catenuloplanes japonicus]